MKQGFAWQAKHRWIPSGQSDQDFVKVSRNPFLDYRASEVDFSGAQLPR